MESNGCQKPLILEKALSWLTEKAGEYKIPFLASMLAGMLAYMFAFANKLLNHDEVTCLFSKGATVSSGRWGLGALDNIFPNFSMPWIYGIITIFLMAAAICVITRIFQIRSRLLQILLAGSIMVFPSLIGTFGYMFTSSSYAVSFLLSVLAVLFLQKSTLKHFLLALACMILSLSIYQSYIAITASLLVLVLIRQLLYETDVLPIIRKGICFVIFLAVSLGMYYAFTQIIFLLKHITFNEYAAENVSISVSSIIGNIGLAYRNFFCILNDNLHRLVPTEFSVWMHRLCLAAAGILLAVWLIEKPEKKAAPVLLLAVLIALLPLAINCMYLFTSADSIHTLVLYSFAAVYVLVLIIADACLSRSYGHKLTEICRRAALNLATIGMAAIIIGNIYIANESYLNLYLRYENAYAFYTSLIADIKMTPGFDENTQLAVIGQWDDPDFYETQFAFSNELTGVTGFKPDSYSKEYFLNYYLGFSIPFASEEEIEAVKLSPEYEEMPVYPYYGSLQKIGDILVVKLS